MNKKQLVTGRLINILGFLKRFSFECRVIVNNTYISNCSGPSMFSTAATIQIIFYLLASIPGSRLAF